METQGIQNKLILKMKDKIKRLTLSDSNNYSTATVSKTAWYVNEIGSSEINSHIYW